MNEISQYIYTYLVEKGAEIDEHNYADYNYIASGIIDSFDILSFIMDIENKFSINFSPEELVNDNISTIQGLSEIISEKLK